MADVSVRGARAEDVAELARIQLETWRAGYASILPASVLESLSVDTARQVWEQAVTSPPSARHHVLIAQEQDWLVGFVAFGPAEDLQPGDPDPTNIAAIGPLLVEPRWGRRGHGSRLLAAAVEHCRTDGMARGIIWVPEGDGASREFLISAGWAPDGLVRALDTGSGEVRELRLHVSLAQVPA